MSTCQGSSTYLPLALLGAEDAEGAANSSDLQEGGSNDVGRGRSSKYRSVNSESLMPGVSGHQTFICCSCWIVHIAMEIAIVRPGTFTACPLSRSLHTVHTILASESSHRLQYETEPASYEKLRGL